MDKLINEKKKSKRIVILGMIIIILFIIIGLILILIKPNVKTNSKKDNLNTNEYEYLVRQLENVEYCKIMPISEYLDMDNLKEENIIGTAIANLKTEKISINETDEFDGTSYDKFYYADLDISNGYKVESIDKEIKKIYGNKTTVNYKTIDPFIYDKTTQTYLTPFAVECDFKPVIYQNITKTTKENNKLYIETVLGIEYFGIDEDNHRISNICNTEMKCADVANIDEKYITIKQDNNDESYRELDGYKYIKDNEKEFSKYKYTFEKEGDNYIIKNLEKIS